MPVNIEFDIEKQKLSFHKQGLQEEQRYLQYAQQAADVEPGRKTERMLNIVAFATALGEQGFDVTVSPYEYNYFTFKCDKKDLPRVYRAVGRLSVASKEVENVRKRLLNVYLKADKFPDYCRIKYEKKLPRGSVTDGDEANQDGQKCKLVRKRTPAKVEWVMECAR